MEESGFRSRQRFHRLFKARTGLSPERYRRRAADSTGATFAAAQRRK